MSQDNRFANIMKGIPEKEQEEFLLATGDIVFRETLVRLVEKMDDATASAFDSLLAKNPSEDEVMAFIAEKVPGYEEVVQGAVDDVSRDMGGILGTKPNQENV